ncbi:aldehyde ferredoxin oxidoreductase family protein [Chloroflexota bacterium]
MSQYKAKLLRINLSTATCRREDIPQEAIANFIGGRGLGAWYLYNEVKPETDPLGPDNKLFFSIGPLAAAGTPNTTRWVVNSKSPLGGSYRHGVGGGDFGAALKVAGLDMIIVEGRAANPVYIYIEDGQCQIKDARQLWGKNSVETLDELKAIHGKKTDAACIGPASENLGLFGNIMTARAHCVGRGGLGTVMGSKNLKAVAINPSGRASAPNQELKALIAQGLEAYDNSPVIPVFKIHGTLYGLEGMSDKGLYPTRNYQQGSLGGIKKVNAEKFLEIKVKSERCYGCPVHCGRQMRLTSGPYAGTTTDGFEHETSWAFTGTIDSDDIATPILADKFCDEMGLDTISAGNAIGFAFELFEKGIITEKDTDGLKLTWGNHEAALKLLEKIANREGLGDILSQGVKRASEHFGKGSSDFAIQVKGTEWPAYDPRAAKWHGLAIATCACAANHNPGYNIQEVLDVPFPRVVDRFAESGTADINKGNEDWIAVVDSLVSCSFMGNMGLPPLPVLGQWLAQVTGISQLANVETILLAGERIVNLERAFNIREGFGRQDDYPPKRFLTEPLKNGGTAEGSVISNYDGMLDEYYAVRGWQKDGIPTAEKLKALGLEKLASDIIK